MDELADLMGRYVEGDSHAFSALYARVAPALLSYLVRMCRARDVAEDLLQESMFKVHRARASYVRGAAPLPWLYAIAHRTFLDHARRVGRAKVRAVSDVPEVAAHITGTAAEDYREQNPLLADRVHAALAKLPIAQRQAVVLTKLEGLSVADAAAVAGTSVGALKVRAHRGYNKLRELLEEANHDH